MRSLAIASILIASVGIALAGVKPADRIEPAPQRVNGCFQSAYEWCMGSVEGATGPRHTYRVCLLAYEQPWGCIDADCMLDCEGTFHEEGEACAQFSGCEFQDEC